MGLEIKLTKKLPNYDLDVSLSCESGRLLALVGPSGAGKTTIVRSIAGLEKPDHGFVALDGEVWWDSETNIWLPPRKRGLGYVFQEFTLFPHLTVAKTLPLPQLIKGGLVNYLPCSGLVILLLGGPMRFPAVSGNGLPWLRLWLVSPRCCCLTSPFPPWILPPANNYRQN